MLQFLCCRISVCSVHVFRYCLFSDKCMKWLSLLNSCYVRIIDRLVTRLQTYTHWFNGHSSSHFLLASLSPHILLYTIHRVLLKQEKEEKGQQWRKRSGVHSMRGNWWNSSFLLPSTWGKVRHSRLRLLSVLVTRSFIRHKTANIKSIIQYGTTQKTHSKIYTELKHS